MLKKVNQVSTSINKTVKISHRPQLPAHKRKDLTVSLNSVSVDELVNKENTKRVESQKKNWPNIVESLK